MTTVATIEIGEVPVEVEVTANYFGEWDAEITKVNLI